MRVLLVSLVCGMFHLAPVSGAAEEPALSGEVLLKDGESALQVRCADQSHFIALFCLPVSLIPKASRDHIKSEDLTVSFHQASVPQ